MQFYFGLLQAEEAVIGGRAGYRVKLGRDTFFVETPSFIAANLREVTDSSMHRDCENFLNSANFDPAPEVGVDLRIAEDFAALNANQLETEGPSAAEVQAEQLAKHQAEQTVADVLDNKEAEKDPPARKHTKKNV